MTDSIGSQFLSHLVVTSVVEYNRNKGFHFQIAYDDLTKHAIAYRQMALFLRKPSGREAYPSDVFFIHARLLERSCNLGRIGKVGSLMSLPIIETLNNDLSAYIATNVISITDGQLYLDRFLFGIGQCPAINTQRSVSRIGTKSLNILWRSTAFSLYSIVSQVKQEAELTVKSSGYIMRSLKSLQFNICLIQRSCQSRHLSENLLLAIHSGLSISIHVHSIYILIVTF